MSQDMESRFYYFQGENPENTKISDRSHALHITGNSWDRITKHLDRKKIAKESLEKEERHKAYLDDGSKAMIKNWANSLENIRKRKDEERDNAIESEKASRAKKFNELRKEQDEIRKKFVEKANRNIFMNKGNAKQLTSAYIMSEVLYEREKQKEFNQFLKKHEDEEYAKEVEDVRRVAREAAEDAKHFKEMTKQKKQEIGEIMRKELAEKAIREKEEAQRKKEKDMKEYNEAQMEMECLKKKALETKLKKKLDMQLEAQKIKEEEVQKKALLATENQELDDVVRVYRDAKEKIDCMRNQKEKALREEAIQNRIEMSKKAMAVSNEEEEEAKREMSLQNAVRELEEKEDERDREKKRIHEKEVHDKLECRKQFLEREEERLRKEAELRKWEMLNRYKTVETLNKFDKDTKMELKKKTMQYREELLEQIAENEKHRKQEEEMDKMITEALIQTDDKKFFAYATEILQQEIKTGRSTYPTEKAIISYKKNFNIPLPPNTDIKCEPYKPPNQRNAMDVFKQSAKIDMEKRKCKCQIAKT